MLLLGERLRVKSSTDALRSLKDFVVDTEGLQHHGGIKASNAGANDAHAGRLIVGRAGYEDTMVVTGENSVALSNPT